MKLGAYWISRIGATVPLDVGNKRRIVLVDTSGLRGIAEGEKARNIYCLNLDDEILWQIQPDVDPKQETDCFVNLSQVGSTTTADRFFGDEFEVDVDTGKASHTGWHK